MRRVTVIASAVVSLVFYGSADGKALGVLALEAEVRQIAGVSELWPGYDPLKVPLAVFDGTNTYLFRHPGAPGGFAHEGDMRVFAGRHPAVVANSSASIGGIRTATILLNGPIDKDALRDLAAEVVHEGFHVFQFTTGRTWGPDEAQLFVYPTDDAELLALSRLEAEALRRALAAPDSTVGAGWAEQAVELRHLRFGRMDPSFGSYERGIETLEGTATYVEFRAAGRHEPEFPPGGFPVEAVRRRAYATGVAWALLLDRLHPGWCEGFADDNRRYLDSDLEDALQRVDRSAACAFTAADSAVARDAARKDVENLRAARALMEQRIISAPGWRLVIEADPTAPLWPQGFDPMNVRRLDAGLLHTRFLRLGNDVGTFEVMGDTVLTEGVGPHPLFNGVRRVTIVRLPAEPQVEAQADTVQIVLPTLSARFRGARVERTGWQTTIHLDKPPK